MNEKQTSKSLKKNETDIARYQGKIFHGKIIKLYINDESDLYNKFSVNKNAEDRTISESAEINPEIINYLVGEACDLPAFIGINVEIRAVGKSMEELAKIEELIKADIRKKIFKTNVSLFKMKQRSVFLLLAAIIPLTIQQIFSRFVARYALKELFLVVAWVFMWKAVEIFFFERKETTKEKKTLRRILKSEFILCGPGL